MRDRPPPNAAEVAEEEGPRPARSRQAVASEPAAVVEGVAVGEPEAEQEYAGEVYGEEP